MAQSEQPSRRKASAQTNTTPASRGKTAAEVKHDAAPYRPAPYTAQDVAAIKALYDGTATATQQRHALDWIVEVAAGTNDLAYRPGGLEGDRDTAFATGKQFVGRQIVKLIKLPKQLLNKEGARHATETRVG